MVWEGDLFYLDIDPYSSVILVNVVEELAARYCTDVVYTCTVSHMGDFHVAFHLFHLCHRNYFACPQLCIHLIPIIVNDR